MKLLPVNTEYIGDDMPDNAMRVLKVDGWWYSNAGKRLMFDGEVTRVVTVYCPCIADIKTIIGKKSNYVIQLFEM